MPKRKVTLYFRDDVLAETQREAVRQDRSISWIIQAAWKLARAELRAMPRETDEPDLGDPPEEQTPMKSAVKARAQVAVAPRRATGKR
jgi:uncharacterized small protein (TIGR04563 family)